MDRHQDQAVEEHAFPLLSPGILFAPTPPGGVVYDLVTERLSFLNASGALVLDACRQGLDRHGFVVASAESSGSDPATIQHDLTRALDHFETAGFVNREDAPPKRYLPDAPVGTVRSGEKSTTQAVGVHRIRFTSQEAALVELVDDLLDLGCEDPPTAQFSIIADPDGTIRLITDTEWRFSDARQFRRTLTTVVNDFVARTMTEVVLHAATLQDPAGRIVVFPAAPGSGKSTLAGSLIQQGWAYGGDESATIRRSDLAVVPCAKPITLDGTSCAVLGVDPALAGDVSVTAIAPRVRVLRAMTPPPMAIIAPCYAGPDGEAKVETLGFDDALVALLGSALNLRYVGEPGLATLIDLAATVPIHAITYRSSAQALQQITSLVDSF